MIADKFFPQRPDSKPTVYAYEDTNPQYRGLLKISYPPSLLIRHTPDFGLQAVDGLPHLPF